MCLSFFYAFLKILGSSPLLNPPLHAYNFGMNIKFLTIAALTVSALVTSTVAADPDFNGEVLIAPPPPNWSGGTPEAANNTLRRVWKRGFLNENGVVEQIAISRSYKEDTITATALARAVSVAITKPCVEKTVTKITHETKTVGVVASFTAQCDGLTNSETADTMFVTAKVYFGEYNTYTVERSWIGNKTDPTSPINSPRTGEQWLAYFSRISVCNTLQSACDVAEAEIIHAHPRYKTMQVIPASVKAIVPQKNALKAARALGQLTGKADSCGEDITPLTSKIGRMFAHVTANDRDSTAAVAAFDTARANSAKAQAKRKRENCGPVLREFRKHPSRVGTFHRYIERFI